MRGWIYTTKTLSYTWSAHVYNGKMVRWYNGTVVQWYGGTMVRWFVGTMVRW